MDMTDMITSAGGWDSEAGASSRSTSNLAGSVGISPTRLVLLGTLMLETLAIDIIPQDLLYYRGIERSSTVPSPLDPETAGGEQISIVMLVIMVVFYGAVVSKGLVARGEMDWKLQAVGGKPCCQNHPKTSQASNQMPLCWPLREQTKCRIWESIPGEL
ncbi:hypothetical protein QBC44DRAFT_310188 [Cladorrhinum sp. PSN332]|nr:hypothetical protein QBC44DRAFT_310188 [Cladorrhinum sp. PSN332]